MAVRLSTALRNKMLDGGTPPAAATSGTLVTGNSYRISAFLAGDDFTNIGAGSNATGVEFTATGTTPTTWTNSSSVMSMEPVGGIKGALNLGFINIYSGAQPLTADTGATGTLLGTVSVDAGGTGLTFDATVAGVIAKATAETWKFLGAATGTAGWFRFWPAGGNPAATSTTEARLDGNIATVGGDMNMSNISIVTSAPSTVDVFSFTLPAA